MIDQIHETNVEFCPRQFDGTDCDSQASDGTNAPGSMAAAYGIVVPINNSDNGFYQIDGEIKFWPIEDGYKEFETTLNKWRPDFSGFSF